VSTRWTTRAISSAATPYSSSFAKVLNTSMRSMFVVDSTVMWVITRCSWLSILFSRLER